MSRGFCWCQLQGGSALPPRPLPEHTQWGFGQDRPQPLAAGGPLSALAPTASGGCRASEQHPAVALPPPRGGSCTDPSQLPRLDLKSVGIVHSPTSSGSQETFVLPFPVLMASLPVHRACGRGKLWRPAAANSLCCLFTVLWSPMRFRHIAEHFSSSVPPEQDPSFVLAFVYGQGQCNLSLFSHFQHCPS